MTPICTLVADPAPMIFASRRHRKLFLQIKLKSLELRYFFLCCGVRRIQSVSRIQLASATGGLIPKNT